MIFDVRYVLIFQIVSLFTYIHTFKNRVDHTQNVRLKTFFTINLFIYMRFFTLCGVFRGNVHTTPTCLARQRYGLTMFHLNNNSRLDSATTPVVYCPRAPSKQRGNQPHTFWFKPVSTFGLFWLTTIQQFTYVSHTTQPRPPPPDAGRLHVASRLHAIRRSGSLS